MLNQIVVRTIIIIVSFVLCSLNSTAQNTFNTLMKYDIKGISLNGKLICPLNGFNHGTVDYGVYKQRGFYFAITLDNAVLGNGIMILETIDFENFDNPTSKGMKCTLKQLSGTNSKIYESSFMEVKKEGMIYLSTTDKINGQDVTITYIMITQIQNE